MKFLKENLRQGLCLLVLASPLAAHGSEGEPLWSFDADNGIRASAAIGQDGTVYVGSYDRHLYALESSGEVRWSFSTSGHIGSSAAIGPDGTVYVGSDDQTLYALNPDG